MLATSGVPPRLLRVLRARGASVKETGQDADTVGRRGRTILGETRYGVIKESGSQIVEY